VTLELNSQMFQAASLLAAGKQLGLSYDEAIATKQRTMLRDQREAQRAQYQNGGIREGNTLYYEDEEYQRLTGEERAFQRDKPIREADLLAMGEYGTNEADLQQVSGGRVESLKAQDASGIGADDRGAKKFNRARRDLLPQRVGAYVDVDGKTEYVDGVNAPVIPGENNPRPVSEDLREATILQEMGLSVPERGEVPYQTSKSGKKRRNFGVVAKDAEGNIIKERMRRVTRPRPSGQPLDPSTVISTDKHETARRVRERGIGDDGPTAIQNPTMSSKAPLIDAYNQIATAVETGQVQLTDVLSNGRTVGETMERLAESSSGQVQVQRAKAAAADTVITDTKARRELARKKLREFAVLAASQGEPLSKAEAEALLVRLNNPKEVSDLKAEREALKNIGSQGSTQEVIGETVMSEDAWKAKSSKQIPSLPIMAKEDVISDDPVFMRVNPLGEVVGHSAGGHFVGEANSPSTLQNLNVPQNQQSLINFISDNLQYDSGGGLKPAIITTATQDFTDIARGLSEKAFGEGVSNIPSGIHSLDEAQGFMDRLIQRRQETGGGFSRFNPDNPSSPMKVPAGETPTVSDLMSTMNVDKATQGRLANALYQMALAEGSDVNTAGKERYADRAGSYQTVYRPEGGSRTVNLDSEYPSVNLRPENITFDSPAGFFYDGVDAQYVPNSKRQVIDGKNVNIQAALRNIQNPDGSRPDPASTEPFIGAVSGEPQGKLRYRKGFGQDVTIREGYESLERSRAKGKRKFSQPRVDSMVRIAEEVENRHNRQMGDKRAVELGMQARSAAQDDALRMERESDNALYNKRRSELLHSIATGSPLPGRGSGPVQQMPISGLSAATRGTATQPTMEAPVAPSISLDPGVPTGNQPAPVVDAGERGGALALISNERSSRQERPSRYYDGNSEFDVASRYEERRPKRGGPMPDSMRKELNALTPKERVVGYMSSPEGPSQAARERREVTRRLKQQNVRNRAAIGAAAVGSLAGILGLSNINKESEEEARV